MTSSTQKEFAKAGRPKSKAKKRPAPFCIRLSEDERAHLERKAGKLPLARYVRSQLLDDEEVQPRKKAARARTPSVDAALLGKALGTLGKSDQVKVLFLLALAEEQERVALSDEDSATLRQACADVRDMRLLLIQALGLKTGEKS